MRGLLLTGRVTRWLLHASRRHVKALRQLNDATFLDVQASQVSDTTRDASSVKQASHPTQHAAVTHEANNAVTVSVLFTNTQREHNKLYNDISLRKRKHRTSCIRNVLYMYTRRLKGFSHWVKCGRVFGLMSKIPPLRSMTSTSKTRTRVTNVKTD